MQTQDSQTSRPDAVRSLGVYSGEDVTAVTAREPTELVAWAKTLALIELGLYSNARFTDPEAAGETGSLSACPEVGDTERVSPTPR